MRNDIENLLRAARIVSVDKSVEVKVMAWGNSIAFEV